MKSTRETLEKLSKRVFEHDDAEYVENIEKVFVRDGLDLRKRLLCALSILTTRGMTRDLGLFVEWALMEEVPPEEIREVVLQTYLFAGYPAAIEGFFVLHDIFKRIGIHVKDVETAYRVDEWRGRGLELCRQIYGKNFDQLRTNMRDISPELEDWMIVEGYGKVLSRPHLGAVERELCTVAALTALGKERQLRSHIKGALNVGATRVEVREVILQTSLFAGHPAALRGLELLHRS